MATTITATTTTAVASFADLRLTSNLAGNQMEEEMKTAGELDFDDSDITHAASESESRFNGKTPPDASAASSSSSAGDISSAAPVSRSDHLHDGKRPKTKYGAKLVPVEVASKQARAVPVQFAAFGDTGNMGPDVLGTWADNALGGEDSNFSRNMQWHLHVLKIVQKQGKNEDGGSRAQKNDGSARTHSELVVRGTTSGPAGA